MGFGESGFLVRTTQCLEPFKVGQKLSLQVGIGELGLPFALKLTFAHNLTFIRRKTLEELLSVDSLPPPL